MVRRNRHYLAWLLALAYGSVSLVGQGLHELLPHPCKLDSDHGTCHCPHDHAATEHLAGHGLDGAEPSLAPPCHDPDQCHICIFLAQAKSSSTLAIALNWVAVSTPHLHVSRESTIPQPLHEPYAPRGPPALFA